MKFITFLFLFITPISLWGAACLVSEAGKVRFNSPIMEFCNGSDWISMKGSLIGACSEAGKQRYSSSQMQFCDGSNWYSMKGSVVAACTAGEAGKQRYASQLMQFCDGSNWYDMAPNASSPPSSLVLTHTANERTFRVSWNAGSGNGGANGCKIQFYRNNSVWTDLLNMNCDANTIPGGQIVSLPNTTGWTNNFNSTGVQVRVIRVSDSQLLGTFAQRLRCVSKAGSASSTPNIDEDCDHDWDDTTVVTSCNATFTTSSVCTGGSGMYYTSVGSASACRTYCQSYPDVACCNYRSDSGGCEGRTGSTPFATGASAGPWTRSLCSQTATYY